MSRMNKREKSFLNLIIVWKIQIKLLFEAYLDVKIAHKHLPEDGD